MLYFEDFQPGMILELPARTVSETEIVDFARRYDPQPFHTDPEAAKASVFGGLVASGWHICALMMRMIVDCYRERRVAGVGSPGVDSCTWHAPLRPGDTLSGRMQVVETWPSRSRPYGFVRHRTVLRNQHGEAVSTVVGIGLFSLRPEPA